MQSHIFEEMEEGKKYVDVILPLKLRDLFSYSVPDGIDVERGSWVVVKIVNTRYLGVVAGFRDPDPVLDRTKIKPVVAVEAMEKVSDSELHFWSMLADYYMCSIGEVFKCAYPSSFFKQVEKSRTLIPKPKEHKLVPVPELSAAQQGALDKIKSLQSEGRNVLFEGVTGSGKTEVYMNLAAPVLKSGLSVLYLVPEIALSKQLEKRLEAVFGAKLLVWHSKQGPAAKKRILDAISVGNPHIVLGTRSAVFLPFRALGLVIIDEEHDSSYKQTDPAPRYNGRDAALMLASIHSAPAVLGSATPSLEALYNVTSGKYGFVALAEKYFGGGGVAVDVIDMTTAYKLHNVKGSFSMKLINMIAATLARGEQVLIFRSRRAYSSYVQCSGCGEVPHCPDCNVALSYHKFNNSLSCHYCGRSFQYQPACAKCGAELVLRGAGTEKLEEELKSFFPEAVIDRFDADTVASKKEEERILKDFSSGRTNIMVGTQMVTKGFDFDNLTLVAVINADSLLCMHDFRADERALQLFEQIK